MCGIAGHIGSGATISIGDGVLDALRHRGPDAQRSERRDAAAVTADLAFARLAIVDLSDAGSSQ
jgi:asparagine synthetase B (glutamine-hydrolysing)